MWKWSWVMNSVANLPTLLLNLATPHCNFFLSRDQGQMQQLFLVLLEALEANMKACIVPPQFFSSQQAARTEVTLTNLCSGSKWVAHAEPSLLSKKDVNVKEDFSWSNTLLHLTYIPLITSSVRIPSCVFKSTTFTQLWSPVFNHVCQLSMSSRR